MKKLWFIPMLLLLVLPEAARAQTYPVDRGSWIVGGSASFTSQGGDDADRTTSVMLNPSAQFFVLPGLAVGGTLSFSYTSDDLFSTTGLGIGSAVSYYFGRGERTVYPFVSASLSIRDFSFKADGDQVGSNIDVSITGTTFDLSGGVALMVAKNVGLTGEIFYLQQNLRETDNGGSETLIGTDLDIDRFGLRFGIAAFVF